MLTACSEACVDIAKIGRMGHSDQVALQSELDNLAPKLKAGSKLLEARYKLWLKLLNSAEKSLRARLSKAFDGKAVRELKRALLAADTKKSEAPTVRDDVLEALKQAAYFIHQVHWLHSRFSEGRFADVPGLCRAVTTVEIASNDYSLTPGRYVGTAPDLAGDDDDFEQTLRDILEELIELNDKAVELAGRIGSNFEVLMG